MKIIHCADLHLDSKMEANLSPEKAKERRAELLITFEEMVKYAVRENICHILISGDLYDKKNISAAARKIIISEIKDHPGIRFYYLKGNHDAEAVLNGFDRIPDNLITFGENWETFRIEGSSVNITGAELPGGVNLHIFDSLVLDNSAVNIVMLHGQTVDYIPGSGDSFRGNAGIIPLKALQNKGIDYLALGHVHARALGKLDRRGIWCYPGCLEGRGFDECGDHGFMLLDIDETERCIKTDFVPIARRTLHEIRADVSGASDSHEAFSGIDRVLKKLCLPAKDMAKIILTGEVEISCDFDLGYLQKKLEDRFYFLKLEDATTLKIDYDFFAEDTSLKGEFVRRILNNPGYSDEEKAELIQHGIRLLMGEIQYAD